MSNITEKPESEVFAETILTVDSSSPLYFQMWRLFCEEMHKAIRGCIATPERMARLYPIFREINIETEESDKLWAELETKDKRREERKKLKAAQTS